MKTPKWFLKKSLIACALLPVSWVYLFISRMVFRMRAHRPLVSRRPIVCVGNILAGGVGKTPIVRQIAEFLDAPVVMRGYKKSNATNNIGDEALMLSRHGLLVHTGDRKSNIILLNKQKSDTPIVMDDGFQNPSIKKISRLLLWILNLVLVMGFYCRRDQSVNECLHCVGRMQLL